MRTIKLFATLRDVAGAAEITVPLEDDATARDLIRAIEEASPELGAKFLDQNGQLTRQANIFIDGRNILVLDGLDTRIAPDAKINVFPQIAGG
jgi:molybdopterin synthase sulfur carrier subunit